MAVKECPSCAEEIQEAATFCRFCQRDLGIGAVDLRKANPTTSPATPTAPATATAQLPETATPMFAQSPALGTPVLLAGWVVVLLAATIASTGRFGWGFLLLWIGTAMVLNRRSTSIKLGGGLVAALLVFIPLALGDSACDSAKRSAENAEKVLILEKELQADMASGRWAEAANAHAELKALSRGHPALLEAWMKIEPEVVKLREQKGEETRRAGVITGLEQTRRVVTNTAECDTPKSIADAWKQLKIVKKSDKEWNEATALASKLDSCRLRCEQAISKGIQQLMVSQRQEWPKNAETTMLDQGMNVEFFLAGAKKDQLTVKWALMSKAVVHGITSGGSMQEGAFLAQMQKVGFKRVGFEDGFDFGVYYHLEPHDEANGGKTVWASLGVTGPLVLR